MSATASPHPRRPTREEVAHHEAGHVVAAYLTGYHVLYADVTIDGDKYAETPIEQDLLLLAVRVRDEGWDQPDDVTLIRQRCFIAAAGYGAEMVYAEKCSQPFAIETARLGALGDRQHVLDLWGSGDAFYRFAEEMATLFRDLAVWQMVSVVARELLRRGRVFADELLLCLKAAMAQLQVPFRLFHSSDSVLQLPAQKAST
jgi:hypothetical protein